MVVVGRDGSHSQIATWLGCPAPPRCPAGTRRCRRAKSPLCKWFPPTTERFCWKRTCESRPCGEPKSAGSRVTDRVPKAGEQWPADTGWSTTSSTTSRPQGSDYVFGVDGANIEDLYDAAYFRADITAVLAKHEFSAATMADGYSRAGSGLGRGGGHLRRREPESGCRGWGSRWPAGCRCWRWSVSRRPRWTGAAAFRTPAAATARSTPRRCSLRCRCYCGRVSTPDDIADRVARAVAAARAGGPAVLLLPKDVQQSHRSTCRADDRCRRAVGRVPVIRSRSLRALRRCAADRSRSSPASRWPATTRATNWSELRARAAMPGWRRCPTPRTSADRPGRSASLGVTGVMGHPGVADAIAQRRGVSAGRHPAVGDRPRWPRRGAARGPDPVDRVGRAVSAVHPRPHRRSARVAGRADTRR